MTPPRQRAVLATVAVLAVLEWLWLAWFLSVPLPNAAAVGARLSRANLLWKALPELIPGVTWGESHLGAAAGDLSHVENLPDRVPILLAAAWIAAGAVALGGLVLRGLRLRGALSRAERLPLAFVLGAAALGVLSLLAGRLGLLGTWSARLGLGGLILIERAWAFRSRSSHPEAAGGAGRPLRSAGPEARRGLLVGLTVAPFLVLMLLGAMLPTIEFDALEYHLQGPKEHFLAGRIAFLPHNVYTSMPFGVEMLHLLGMHVLGDWWAGALAGQVLVMLHAPAAAALIALAARRCGSPRAGAVAAVAYLTAPWVVRLAVTPYVEGPLAASHAALIWTAVRARSEGSTPVVRLWGVAGLLAGGALGCKYPALLSAVIPFGAVAAAEAVRRRRGAIVLAYAAGVALLAGPWLVKNVVDTGNPVYPLAYRVFGGTAWDAAREARWSAAHGPRPVTVETLTTSLLEVAGRSDWQSPLFLALAPLALLRPGSRRAAVALGAYAAYLFATWYLLTHRVDRFWIPMLPALAVLAGLGADWAGGRAWAVVRGGVLAVGVASNLVFATTDLAGSTRWTDALDALRAEVPADVNPPLARLDAALPEGAKVLVVGQAAVFHLRHPVVTNTVFDPETIEGLARDRTPEGVRRAFRARGITHVYVDWAEVDRYRQPGNYGYSDFVTPALFDGLVAAGALEPMGRLGPQHELYRVR